MQSANRVWISYVIQMCILNKLFIVGQATCSKEWLNLILTLWWFWNNLIINVFWIGFLMCLLLLYGIFLSLVGTVQKNYLKSY